MIRRVPTLVTITGPIAGGKNTVASALADLLNRDGSSVVIADVDDVAAMVQGQGAGALGLWFAAHAAHGALVAEWMRSPVDVVVADDISEDASTEIVKIGAIPVGRKGLDIGPQSVQLFARELTGAHTVFWNGPMGVFEVSPFAAGTKGVAEAIAVSIYLETRKIVTLSDQALAEADAGVIAGLTI